MREIVVNENTMLELGQSGEYGTRYKAKGMPYVKLVINKTKITCFCQFNFRGQRYRKRIGHYPEVDIESLTRLCTEYYQQVKYGGLRPGQMTLDEFFVQVFVPISKGSKRTFKCDVSRYRTHVHARIGKLNIDEVRPIHIRKLLSELPAHLSNATRNRVRSLVHRLFQLAIENELILRNPCTLVKPLQENNVVERIMTEEETQAFVQVAGERAKRGEMPSLALLLALYTGLRIGNVISLERGHINWSDNSLLIERTKSGRSQSVPLSLSAKRVIDLALSFSTSKYLFSSPVRPDKHVAYPKDSFKRICIEAGIALRGVPSQDKQGFNQDPLTIHCLRKTFASRVLQKTGDIYLCSKLLGHSDVSVTQRYAFYRQSGISAAVEGIF